MTDEQLKRANELKRQIEELQEFLDSGRRIFEFKSITKLVLKTGRLMERYIDFSGKDREKIEDVIREILEEKKKELEEL